MTQTRMKDTICPFPPPDRTETDPLPNQLLLDRTMLCLPSQVGSDFSIIRWIFDQLLPEIVFSDRTSEFRGSVSEILCSLPTLPQESKTVESLGIRTEFWIREEFVQSSRTPDDETRLLTQRSVDPMDLLRRCTQWTQSLQSLFPFTAVRGEGRGRMIQTMSV